MTRRARDRHAARMRAQSTSVNMRRQRRAPETYRRKQRKPGSLETSDAERMSSIPLERDSS